MPVFLSCKQKVAAGEALNANLVELVSAAASLWSRLQKGSIKVRGQTVPLNGEVGMLFRADDVTKAERTILGAYFKTTRSIAGCQAIRRRIGHCLFGMRAVQGECIFVTISPNRRNSGLVLHLSRLRANDPTLHAQTDVAQCRAKNAGSMSPSIFIDGTYDDQVAVEEAYATLNYPPLKVRQDLNAQDPLSSVHHYLFSIRVLLAAAFGVRMCFNCPHCNEDTLNNYLQLNVY